MTSNSFGSHFRITTFGESHGQGVGVVIDGCPAGLEISEEEINAALEKRRPGKISYASPRSEPDLDEISDGFFILRKVKLPRERTPFIFPLRKILRIRSFLTFHPQLLIITPQAKGQS